MPHICNLTFSFATLGCKLNQHESDGIINAFLKAGFTQIDQHQTSADIAIINSCAVTGKSEQKSRRAGRLLGKQASVTIMTGCAASLSQTALEALLPNVVVVASSQKSALLSLPNHLKDISKEHLYTESKLFLDDFSATEEDIFAFDANQTTKHTRIGLKIEDGCDKQCSYCATRLARGKAVSLASKEIICRLNRLAGAGYKEIILTGVNLASYYDAEAKIDFWGLLKTIFEQTAGFRLRLSSLEPQSITPALIPLLQEPRLCPHFHLSIQSGSNTVLNAMYRPYQKENIIEAVKILRQAKEDPFLACDVIAGFPGETQDDFLSSYNLLKELDLSFVHAFAFSPRPGTIAATLKNRVPERIRDERVKLLNDLARQQLEIYSTRSTSKIVEVILEENSVPSHNLRRGRSNYYHDLQIENVPAELPKGALIRAKICKINVANYVAD